MAQFSVNPERCDPYKNFKFRVKWDSRYVAGVSEATQPISECSISPETFRSCRSVFLFLNWGKFYLTSYPLTAGGKVG